MKLCIYTAHNEMVKQKEKSNSETNSERHERHDLRISRIQFPFPNCDLLFPTTPIFMQYKNDV